MNKIKWTILTFAILFSIGSAFATRPHALGTLYYYNGEGYLPVSGTMGVNYVCETSSDVCTYTYSGGVYTPYQTLSSYVTLGATTPSKPEPKKNEQ
jgi:Family of unknown function (DUF6520)